MTERLKANNGDYSRNYKKYSINEGEKRRNYKKYNIKRRGSQR
jgi:hypothetical protein